MHCWMLWHADNDCWSLLVIIIDTCIKNASTPEEKLVPQKYFKLKLYQKFVKNGPKWTKWGTKICLIRKPKKGKSGTSGPKWT